METKLTRVLLSVIRYFHKNSSQVFPLTIDLDVLEEQKLNFHPSR